MSKRNPSTKERKLAEQLRREAAESRPEFSESLHQRIADAVRQFHAAGVVPADRAAATRRRQRGLAAVFAAACLLCAVAIGWRFIENAQQHSGNDAPVVASAEHFRLIDELTEQATLGLTDLAASATPKPQAALKHDAQLAADTLLDPLPIDVTLVSDR